MNTIEYYLEYLKCLIFIKNVRIIQKYIRMYIFKKRLKLYIHKHKSRTYLQDIIELSYLPPDDSLPILKNGGYHYRYHENSFYINYRDLLLL